MYRIRLTDGRELEYPSIQEFSAAVREGTVDADASIYHRRAERWLPVREHPHFIRAREEASQAPSPAQGVDLDAIFSLLESPGGRKSPSPAASAPSAPRHVASTPEPKADEPVPTKPTVGAVGDLQVLRTGFEPDESTAPEASQAQADAAKESEQLEEPEALRESTIPIEDLTPPPDPAPPPPTPATRAGFLPAIPSAAEASPASPPVPAASAPEEPKSTADAKPSGRSDDLPWLAAPEPSKKAPWFFGNEASIRPAPATPVEPAIPSSPITLGSSYTEATDESGRELADESGLDPADIPSPELVAATAPAVPADVPDLDWPSKVDDIAEPVGLRSARSWLPVAAGVVAILVIIAVVMIRKASSGSVEREGLQVAVETASATPAPAVRRSEETAALVTPPTVPVGSPSPAPIEATPVPADTAGADAIAPRVRAVPNRIKINPGTIALAPVNLSAGGGIRSHADLMRFYDGSYNAAQAGLEADLVRSGFSRLFGAGTLTTSAGLAQGRRSLSAGRSAMGNYRLRQTAIERAYHDSLKAAGRRLGMSPGELSAWAPRPSRKEPEAAASLAEPLLDRTDEVLELLQREIGHYRLQGNTLVFENRAAADRYAALRSQIGLGLAGLDQAHLTLRAVGRALGSPRLPLEVVK